MSTPHKPHKPGFLALVNDAKTRVKQINIDWLQETPAPIESSPSHDRRVREDNELEFAAGHAAGAMHLGKGIIERDIETKVPDKSAKLILYCGGGFRSALAADALQKMGYTDVISLDGGWRAWNEAGLPTEK